MVLYVTEVKDARSLFLKKKTQQTQVMLSDVWWLFLTCEEGDW